MQQKALTCFFPQADRRGLEVVGRCGYMQDDGTFDWVKVRIHWGDHTQTKIEGPNLSHEYPHQDIYNLAALDPEDSEALAWSGTLDLR